MCPIFPLRIGPAPFVGGGMRRHQRLREVLMQQGFFCPRGVLPPAQKCLDRQGIWPGYCAATELACPAMPLFCRAFRRIENNGV